MAYDKFIIGYIDDKSGYQSNLKPFLINDNAFAMLENAYVFRGRVRKRFGSVLMGINQLESRLAINIGAVASDGTFTTTVPGDIFAVGQMFSVGLDIYTVYVTGTPGTMLTTSISGTGTYDTTVGTVTLAGEVALMDVWFYPATPVMGLDLYFRPTLLRYDNIAFDQQFSYLYDAVNFHWFQLSIGGSIGMTDGSGNYSNIIFVSQLPVGTTLTVGTTIFTVVAATLITPYDLTVSAGGTGTATFDPTTPGSGIGTLTITTSELSTSIISSYPTVWTGTDAQFFWMINYNGAGAYENWLWVSNNNISDGIRYFDGIGWNAPLLNYTKGDIVGTTLSNGTASGNITPGVFFTGQVFTIGITFFTVIATTGALQVSPGGTGTGTFDTTTGDFTFTGVFALNPIFFSGDNYINTAKILIGFKNRLLLFNTNEVIDGVAEVFVNRLRWSFSGNPIATNAWFDDTDDGASFLDCPSQEQIKTVEFIRDRLIAYLEESTYEVVFTNNDLEPFKWQKLNTELGADSTYSSVPFDKAVLAIDAIGIHACNGTNVERIDNKIPSLVWNFDTESKDTDRVAGIRDFYTEQAYWTYLSQDRNSSFVYPNKVLAYNYVSDSWAIFDDSFTTFGYYLMLSGTPGATWGNTTIPWGQNTSLWNSSSDAINIEQVKRIIAGNQEGFVVVLNDDLPTNASCLQVTNFVVTANGQATVTIINHNLSLGDYIKLSNMNGMTFVDTNSTPNTLTEVVCAVFSDTVNNGTTNTFTGQLLDNNLRPMTITGTYLGGGTAARMSVINIQSKQYNFYTSDDRNIYIPKVDFLVDKTNYGAITADYFISSTSVSIVNEGVATAANPGGPLPGTNVLETYAYNPILAPLERYQERLWHPVYFYADGECVQLQLYLSNQQMFNYIVVTTPDTMVTTFNFVADEDFQMHSMIIYAKPTSSRMQ